MKAFYHIIFSKYDKAMYVYDYRSKWKTLFFAGHEVYESKHLFIYINV